MFQLVSLTDQAIYGVVVLLGLSACFFGYRLIRCWLALAGMQTGFYLGLWLGGMIFKSQIVTLILAILFGLFLAGLFAIFIKIGGFLAGAAATVLLAALVIQALPFGSGTYIIYTLLGALLIGGVLGLLSVRPFLILATALNGAYLAADSIANLITGAPPAEYVELHRQLGGSSLILLLTGIAMLTILGAVVQFQMERKRGIRTRQAAVPSATPSTPITPAVPVAPPQDRNRDSGSDDGGGETGQK